MGTALESFGSQPWGFLLCCYAGRSQKPGVALVAAARYADHGTGVGKRRAHAQNDSSAGRKTSHASERHREWRSHGGCSGWRIGSPGIGWSTEHGDLRIPHFFGLHGAQVVPVLAWLILLRRRRPAALVLTTAASYLILYDHLAGPLGESIPAAEFRQRSPCWVFGSQPPSPPSELSKSSPLAATHV